MLSAFAVGVAAFAFGLFLLVSNGDGDAAPPIVSESASPTAEVTGTPRPTPARPSPTATPTLAPTGTASPTPTATPGPAYTVSLASWSETESRWVSLAHNGSTSDYQEGEFVPFLLRIEGASRGTTYDVTITYDCLSSGVHAFDYLAGLEDATEPLLTDPGPGNTVPDSSLVAPDDASIAFDQAPGSSFKAWGALFSAASGPSPQTECRGTKSVSLSLSAQVTTLWLVWTGHLASAADWGQGNGAASAAPFGIAVDVNGEVQQGFTMASGSIDALSATTIAEPEPSFVDSLSVRRYDSPI